MQEIWKDIEGYEGRYQISNYGRIRGLRFRGKARTVPKILSQPINCNGYHIITIRDKNNKRKTFIVHRLVAKAFIPNPNNFPVINHKDENKLNNHVQNLEWCTVSYNTKYSLHRHKERMDMHIKRFYETVAPKSKWAKRGIAHTRLERVSQYTMDGDFVKEYETASIACCETGIPSGDILRSCENNAKKRCSFKRKSYARGYVWEFS